MRLREVLGPVDERIDELRTGQSRVRTRQREQTVLAKPFAPRPEYPSKRPSVSSSSP